MCASLLARVGDRTGAAVRRLRGVLWPITQTAVAAGLAWYVAHDIVGHRQPFFAPIAAAVCLSASDVLRTQRAVQMIIGVTFGIGLGAAVQSVLGTGPVAIAVAVLIALCGAVLIGQGYIAQGLMFFNQITVSATLVIAVSRGADVVDRLVDTLIGGGLAIAFAALLFPGNPLTVLRRARADVLAGTHDVLLHIAEVLDGRTAAADWPVPDIDQVSQRLGILIQARVSARQTLLAPRRWSIRARAQEAERQTVGVEVFAGSVLHLARVVTAAHDAHGGGVPHTVPAVIADLDAAAVRVDTDAVTAAEHVAAAGQHAASLSAAARTGPDYVLADAVQTCVDDLQQVLDLRQKSGGPAA